MKNLIATLLLGMTALQPVLSQSNFYNYTMYGGMSPRQTPSQSGLIVNREDPMNEFVFNLYEIEKSYVFGFRKNFRFSYPFFGTLGLEYSKQTQLYDRELTYGRAKEGDLSLTTTSHEIVLPAGVGVKIKKLDITSGLRMQYALQSSMKEDIPSGIEMTSSKVQMGWYSGIGYSFGRTRIGVQYEASLSRYGNNLKYKNQSLELNSVPGNIRCTVGFSF